MECFVRYGHLATGYHREVNQSKTRPEIFSYSSSNAKHRATGEQHMKPARILHGPA